MEYMDWHRFSLDLKRKVIQKALQVCAGKYKKNRYRKPIIYKKIFYKYEHMEGKYPGDKVQRDIKYVPAECVRFSSYGNRYYQITGIDEYSRKRVLKIVKEKSTY